MPYSHSASLSWAIVLYACNSHLMMIHQAAEICYILYYIKLDTLTLVNLLLVNNSLIYELFVDNGNNEIIVIFIYLLLY